MQKGEEGEREFTDSLFLLFFSFSLPSLEGRRVKEWDNQHKSKAFFFPRLFSLFLVLPPLFLPKFVMPEIFFFGRRRRGGEEKGVVGSSFCRSERKAGREDL